MPRDLSDVLHYFMPELGAKDAPGAEVRSSRNSVEHTLPQATHSPTPTSPRPRQGDEALPLAAIIIDDREVVRASLIAGLADEIAALGGDATILTPRTHDCESLFPLMDCSPAHPEQSAVRVLISEAQNLAELHQAATEVARDRAGAGDGVVIVRIPPNWLRGAEEATELLDWLLLITATDTRNLADTYAMAARVWAENPSAEIGVTIYGAEGRREAEDAFGTLAQSAEQRLGQTLACYGLLVEDLDVYRAIVAREPIGRTNGNSIAAHALREAAKLVFERARKAEFQ
ncbi:MAG: hypothetical protein ACI8W3_000644 [Myxococcota bacterium]|jgi:hypothetical protein